MFVLGCQASGVYGSSCAKRCPINCRDDVCHIQEGTCFDCAPGWLGTVCNKSMIKLQFSYHSDLTSSTKFQKLYHKQIKKYIYKK